MPVAGRKLTLPEAGRRPEADSPALEQPEPVPACSDYATSKYVFFHNRSCRHVSVNVEEKIMGRTPNDDRSDSLNPNSDAYSSSQDNRSDQLNPNNERYQGGEKADSDNEDE